MVPADATRRQLPCPPKQEFTSAVGRIDACSKSFPQRAQQRQLSVTHMTHTKRRLLQLGSASMLAGCASAPRGGPGIEADFAITQVAVVDVERGRLLPDHAVSIKGDRIVAVRPTAQARFAVNTRVIRWHWQVSRAGPLGYARPHRRQRESGADGVAALYSTWRDWSSRYERSA